MVVANAPVDILALKSRHPLGDAVEAAGVRLRGRGRVRQGVCPFHNEVEGSFTVYADTEKFYCFGCGLGGDVLDFIQRVGGPEPARCDTGGWTAAPGWFRLVPSGPGRRSSLAVPAAAVVPPRDTALLDGGGPVLRRAASPQLLRRGSTLPPGASAWTPPCGWASATRRGAGCAKPSSPPASPPSGLGTPACSRSGARSGSRGWSVVPEVAGGLVRWLAGRAVDPDAAAKVPGAPRSQAGAWPWAARLRSAVGGARRRALRLACDCGVGPSRLRRPGRPGRGEGRGLPAGLPPRLPRLRLRRRGP